MATRVSHDSVREDLTAQVNGQAVIFTTTYKYVSGTLRVRVNGIDQGPLPGPCSEVTETSFAFNPYVLQPPDTLYVVYSPKSV